MTVIKRECPKEFVLMDVTVLTEILEQINKMRASLETVQERVERALQWKRTDGKTLSDLVASVSTALQASPKRYYKD